MKWHQTQALDMDISISIRARVGIGHRQGISGAINKVPQHWQTRHGHRHRHRGQGWHCVHTIVHWYKVFLYIYQMFKNVISVTYEIALDTGHQTWAWAWASAQHCTIH